MELYSANAAINSFISAEEVTVAKTVVLTGVGRDKVGIVARLTEALFDLGCNLLDSSMTLLRGEFAVILMISLPDGSSLEVLSRRLDTVQKELGFTLHMRELSEDEINTAEQTGNQFIISVYGADKPGIVSAITKRLAELKANITDVETKRTGSAAGHSPIFLMVLEVMAPLSLAQHELKTALNRTAHDLGVDISVSELECVEL